MSLTTLQMALMSRLLDEALPLDESARRIWLDQLSPEYQDISQALREALLPDDRDSVLKAHLDTFPSFGLGDFAGGHAHSGMKPGTQVGPYRLIRLLGAGGMAEVWLAERADGAFKREVALKLPMLTRMRKDLEQRFARERDILASLEHTHIARLYDAGIDSDRLPYLSMEYVRGEQLTHWCDKRRLGIRHRLALMLQVLDAVQYAHQKRVVHRDLKPSNILVTESGQVRLLDFGVAKLLEDAQTADQTQLTNVYGRALTPGYSSPELLRGDTVDARSDIYSLGVLLYEMLTGARPYDLNASATLATLQQTLDTIDVKRPSSRIERQLCAARDTTQEQLTRLLRGDLDAVTLKALAKEPSERYASASGMAEDLQRYLRREPVEAQPPRLSYRVRKFVLRRRTEVVVTTIATAAVLVTVGYPFYLRMAGTDIGANVHAATAPIEPPISDKSIAVLAFSDMSEKKDQEYFADGLAEEMLKLLAKTPGLEVIARTSSFSFKGRTDDVPTIAKKLHVANVLEGSVRKSDNRLRVTAQLVRADSTVLWSEVYDRELKDVFEMQDEIAAAVVRALKLKLAPSQHSLIPRGTVDADAYNEYLLGRQLLNRANDPVGYRRAADVFQKAIKADAKFAAPYAGLMYAEAIIADQTDDAAGMKRAEADADKAVALAPDSADGYAARGYLRFLWMWDWDGARSDFENALALDGGDSTVQRHYGQLLGCLGRLSEAIAAAKKSTELDPLSDASWLTLGRYLMADRQFAAAHEAIHRALEIQPEDSYVLHDLGTLELLEGNPQAASATFGQVRSEGVRLMGIAMTEHSLGHATESREALDQLIAKNGQAWAYQIAEVYAWRGERDHAFEWLQRGYDRHDGGLSNIKIDALLFSLHGDARFGDMLRKMKLPA
jgi:serine/threonine protein kinase/tetratricopeptide (TPR) repeat protein